MQRILKKLVPICLFALGSATLPPAHANDISIYPAPFNTLNNLGPNPADPAQIMRMETADGGSQIQRQLRSLSCRGCAVQHPTS